MGSDRRRSSLAEARRISIKDAGAWSARELGVELAQTSAEVYGAEARERAAEARHLSERTPEAEIAYRGAAGRRSVSASGTRASRRSSSGGAERRPGRRIAPKRGTDDGEASRRVVWRVGAADRKTEGRSRER